MTAYCPAHDPILHAGLLHCVRCDAKAYPTDAEWVDETKILVSFEWACEHRGGEVWFVDVTRLKPLPAAPRARAVRRCGGTTQRGTPCRVVVRLGRDRCYRHARAQRGA